MFVSSDLWQAVVVLLFCCTQLGRCRGSSGWLTVLLLTEEMAALSSTPWQAKVKLWTNSHKEEKQRIKGKSERCDSVAVGDWGLFFIGLRICPIQSGNMAVLKTIYRILGFASRAILTITGHFKQSSSNGHLEMKPDVIFQIKWLHPNNKDEHTFYKTKQTREIFVAFRARKDLKSLSGCKTLG